MQKVISALATFVLGFLISAILFQQHGLDKGGSAGFFTETPSVPLVVLSGLLPIYLFTLWLVVVFLRHVPVATAAFPRFWVEAVEAPQLGVVWERLSAGAILGLPVLGFAHFWGRLAKGDVWGGCADQASGLWTLFWQFEGYRYGDMAAACGPKQGPNGVTFYPFWQPFALLVLSLLALAMIVWIWQRWRERTRGGYAI